MSLVETPPRNSLLWGMLLICLFCSDATATAPAPTSSEHLAKDIMAVLQDFDGTRELEANVKFGVLLGEFLIKQKVRFYESNRYEEQLYFGVLQKLNALIAKPLRADVGEQRRNILRNIFQRDIRLMRPTLKPRHIAAQLPWRGLVRWYDDVVDVGLPDPELSDACLLNIVSLGGNCSRLRDDCLGVMKSDSPTYGYRRMHQILLLYVFMHHQCSRVYASEAAYELLAARKCSQVYREHRVIEAMGLPDRYVDLYAEQNVICGLFGYAEYVNWQNLDLMHKWLMHKYNGTTSTTTTTATTIGSIGPASRSSISEANRNRLHMKSLALVHYINAMLLLV